MNGEQAKDRTVLRVSGQDREKFLQDLVSNDISGPDDVLVYTALLTPQGKFLFDFFVFKKSESIFLDVASQHSDALAQRLNLYRLRADVGIEKTPINVRRGLGAMPDDAMPDPRHPALGWRSYGEEAGAEAGVDWDLIRVTHIIPETDKELIANETYILEAGFDRLNGVDFKKGCYVGQEITARMKHKTELRKGLAQVSLSGNASPGEEITADGKPVGRLHTVAQDHAIAYVRFDRVTDTMKAGNAEVKLVARPTVS